MNERVKWCVVTGVWVVVCAHMCVWSCVWCACVVSVVVCVCVFNIKCR